jgi:hypothetical protein
MELIELEKGWAVRIVLCTSAETLEINDEGLGLTETEIVNQGVHAAQEVIFDRLGDFGEEDSFFKNWNGGQFTCAKEIHASFYVREITKDDEGEEEFGDWEWFADFRSTSWIKERLAKVPTDLVNKAEKAVKDAENARDKVFAEIDERRRIQGAGRDEI